VQLLLLPAGSCIYVSQTSQHSAQGGGGVSGCARGSWRGEGSRAEAQTVLWRQSASRRSCRCVLTDPPGVTRFMLRPLHPPATLHLRPCPRRLAWTALQAEHAAGPEACHILKSGSRPDAPRPPGSRRTCKRIRRPPAAPGPPATTSSTGRSGLDGASAQRDSSLNQGVLCSLSGSVLFGGEQGLCCLASGRAGTARAALVWK